MSSPLSTCPTGFGYTRRATTISPIRRQPNRLAAGGLTAKTYRRRLLGCLARVDRFFDGAPNPGAPRLWTAAAYDRCLLLALVYPIAVLTIACVLSVQFFDAMATMGGGLDARILPLDPLFASLVGSKMRASRPPAVHDRLWMTGVLTLQILLGAVLGIAVQAGFVYLLI